MLGLLLSILLINILSHYGYKLYFSILSGVFIFAIFNRIPLGEFYSLFFTSVTSELTLTLALIVITMTAFGNLLKETGAMNNMVEKLSLIVRDRRHQVMLLPALISLLAFPGGAVLSAPLVDEAGSDLEFDRAKLAFINIVFRHIPYLIFPLYSGLILLTETSGINVFFFIRLNLLPFIILWTCSYFFVFRDVSYKKQETLKLSEIPAFLWSVSPIILTVMVATIFNVYFPLAILTGIFLALFQYLPLDSNVGGTLISRVSRLLIGINWSMTLSFVFILVLKDFMQASGVINSIIEMMLTRNISWPLIAVVIPFFVGFVTGKQAAAIAMSVPIFLTAIPFPEIESYLVLIFITSLAGYLSSPLHLCNVATAEYFGVPIQLIMKKINIVSAFLVMMGIGYFFALSVI